MPTLRRISAALFIASIGWTHTAPAQQPRAWFTTWTSSNQQAAARPLPDSVDRVPTYVNRTLRQIVRTSIGGNQVRVRFSNEYGDRPLVIGAARVAVRDSGASIVASTDREMLFGGRPAVTIRPGATIVSDPVSFTVPALRDIAITIF
jgi:hypothetical protein